MKLSFLLFFTLFPLSLCAQEDSIPAHPADWSRYKTGTHHSLSYASPQWYWRPFAWMAKCQKLTLAEQVEQGVCYFDIRVRFQKDKVISGHGFLNYDIDVLAELAMLDSVAVSTPIFVHIMYENKLTGKNPTLEELTAFMENLKVQYPHLTFLDSHIKKKYTLVLRGANAPINNVHQFFSDYQAQTFWDKLKGLRFPFPAFYARRNNKKYWNELDSTKINVFDFIEVDNPNITNQD
jgi:hypothetical protein